MTDRPRSDLFDSNLEAWQQWQQSPWGRVRYAVVAETLRRTCAAIGPGPLRVLDVGGGDGGDALPLTEAGHDVTILDFSEPLLARAKAAAAERGVAARLTTACVDLAELPSLDLGTFDVVVCHNVVQYQAGTTPLVQQLAATLSPGGALSLMSPNPASEVLAAVIRRGDIREATELLTAETARTQTFDHDVRRVSAEEAETALRGCGFANVTRYGIRCVTDYIVDDARKHEADFYADLERFELELCDREPFIRTARLWQLVARRSDVSAAAEPAHGTGSRERPVDPARRR